MQLRGPFRTYYMLYYYFVYSMCVMRANLEAKYVIHSRSTSLLSEYFASFLTSLSLKQEDVVLKKIKKKKFNLYITVCLVSICQYWWYALPRQITLANFHCRFWMKCAVLIHLFKYFLNALFRGHIVFRWGGTTKILKFSFGEYFISMWILKTHKPTSVVVKEPSIVFKFVDSLILGLAYTFKAAFAYQISPSPLITALE